MLTRRKRQAPWPALRQLEHPRFPPSSPLHLILRFRHLSHCRKEIQRATASEDSARHTATGTRFREADPLLPSSSEEGRARLR